MKLSLPLLLSLVTADILPRRGTVSVGNPAGCPVITCVMFCKDGLQKDDKGCDKCSCVRDGGKLATGLTNSCTRDAHGCCSEMGIAYCPDQQACVSITKAVIPCKSWANNPPVTTLPAVQSTRASTVPTFPSTGASMSASTGLLSSSTLGTSTALRSPSLLPAVLPPPSGISTVGTVPPLPAPLAKPPSLLPAAGMGATLGVSSRCSDVMCALYCPNGFQKDSRGCDMCACAGSSSNKCLAVDCGSSTCPGGFSKDSKGCPTCICLTGAVVAPLQEAVPKVDPLGPISVKPVATPVPAADAKVPGARADVLVAIDRPTVSLNPCKPSPCRSSQKCVPSPQQCIQAPCPQYTCKKAKGAKNGKSRSP